MSPTTASPSLPAEPLDVLEFATEQALVPYLRPLLFMTRCIFPDEPIRLRLEEDPEIANLRTIVIEVDVTDWTVEDRLLLRSSGAGRETAPVAEMIVPGPVQAIGVGIDAGSASVVVHNISTGNYEVYRVGLSCAN